MNLITTLGWTLLHFLWQGALIALLLACVLALLRGAASSVRYAVCCGAMVLMMCSAAATFLELRQTPFVSRAAAYPNAPASQAPAIPAMPGPLTSKAVDYLPALVWAWFGGVIALSIRSLGGWAVAERFARRHTRPAEPAWEERFALLTMRLSIRRPVRLAVSALAQVPATVGWMKPVVLVPAAVFTGLDPEQVQALLAHELAHIRRHDYLVNLLQTVVETLFFYHPAVWWVSRVIREERENCCDDIAVEVSGNALVYARALAELEQMRAPGLAMAATGGSLLNRVHRLLHADRNAGRASTAWIAGIGVVAFVFVAGVIASGSPQVKEIASNVKPVAQVSLEAARDLAESVKHTLIKPHRTMLAQQRETATPQPAAQKAEEKPGSESWIDQIQAEGYRNVKVDDLISMKIHGVTGAYIREMRAAGFGQLTADDLVAFRIHGVTADFANELKQAGLQNLKPDDLISMRIHGGDPAYVRQIQALGFSHVTADDIVSMRIQGVTPEFIHEAQQHGLKDLTIDQLIQLKRLGILKSPELF
jgi:beta-lactamase regulating signal transducer with metallopeptidase domain